MLVRLSSLTNYSLSLLLTPSPTLASLILDGNGTIDYEEFIQGVRDPLTPRRLDLVGLAFAKIDLDGSGVVEPHEVVKAYNADKHPDFISGKKTKDQIMREFLDTFDVGGTKDGMVTRREFENYYTNIGANIDDDDYFELMIRNAWHIAGGKGWCESSANKRVLVTHSDGSQSVVEMTDDLGMPQPGTKEYNAEVILRLKRQGVDVSGVDTTGSTEEEAGKKPAAEPESAEFQGGGKKGLGVNNPTFTSSIQLAGVGEAPGKGRVGKVGVTRAKKATVAADHVDIHTSDLKTSLGFVAQQSAAPKSVSLAEAAGTGGVTAVLDRLKSQLASRGARGIVGLGRKFRIMDDSGNGALNNEEFKKAMSECALSLTDSECTNLFKYFDKDNSGDIDFEEFLGGVRGAMSPKRMEFVYKAFDILDKDGNGFVEPSDIVSAYNAKKHPDVMSGKKTEDEVLREFLDTFDVGGEKDGKVTKNEFHNYYKNVSMSIDRDDYFELMMRNAWHISGGEGWSANSANKRVLVTDSKGVQSVVEIKNDLGMPQPGSKEYNAEVMKRLKAQGTDVVAIDTKGSADDDSTQKKSNPNFAKSSIF
jgi:Ca2+-binding EF-hand superfamily protein